MARIEFNGTFMTVRQYWNAAQVSAVPDGAGFSIAELYSPISANLTANSPLFLARLNPAAVTGYRACITKLIIEYTTITAYTSGIVAGRRLGLYRGSGAGGGSGSTITPVSLQPGDVSQMNPSQGGDIRIAAPGLTTTATFETQEVATFSLVNANTAGTHLTFVLEYDVSLASPLVLAPGELIAIRNPVNLDAAGAGTFQLGVTMFWQESIY